MTRKPIESSTIKSIGHDPNEGVLEIEFNSGQVHRYHGVASETHQRLVNHPSPGGYFHANIKERFRSTKAK